METVQVMIRKRKNSKGQPCYQVIIRDNDGHPPKYETFPTLQEAKDWEVKERARRREEVYFPERINKKQTVGELIDKYIAEVLPNKPKSARDTERHLNWWKGKIGNLLAKTITADVIDKHCRNLKNGVTSKGTARNAATVNRYIASLSVVFTFGYEVCRWISENPMLQVSKLRESRGRTRFLSIDECEKLMESCSTSKNPYLEIIVTLALLTGMRRGEILNLQWEDILFDKALLFIKEAKNGDSRYAALEPEILKSLQKLYDVRSATNPFVFPSKKRFGQICIRKAFEEAVKRAGMINFRFHDLRHTFATYARMDGASIFEVMLSMGHKTPATTQKYSHPEEATLRRTSKSVVNNLFQWKSK